MDFAHGDIGDWRVALCADAWFASCPAQLQDALLANAQARHLAGSEALYRRDDAPAHALFCVLEGAVCIGGTSAGGASSLVVYLQPFHWFGDVALIDGLPRQHEAFADGGAVVLCVALAPFRRWLDHHPVHWHDVARLSAYKLRVAYEVIADPGSLPQRLARRLWWMVHGFGSHPTRATRRLCVAQEVLAQMMGCSRQSVHAALHELEAQGALRRVYRGLEVVDVDRLRELAELRI